MILLAQRQSLKSGMLPRVVWLRKKMLVRRNGCFSKNRDFSQKKLTRVRRTDIPGESTADELGVRTTEAVEASAGRTMSTWRAANLAPHACIPGTGRRGGERLKRSGIHSWHRGLQRCVLEHGVVFDSGAWGH
jgi:hypothetical protein